MVSYLKVISRPILCLDKFRSSAHLDCSGICSFFYKAAFYFFFLLLYLFNTSKKLFVPVTWYKKDTSIQVQTSFAQSPKTLSKFWKLSAISKHRDKNYVMISVLFVFSICFIYTAPQACSFKHKPCINIVASLYFFKFIQ